jgi:hypothetical protein
MVLGSGASTVMGQPLILQWTFSIIEIEIALMVRIHCLHSDVAFGNRAIDCLWLPPTSRNRLFIGHAYSRALSRLHALFMGQLFLFIELNACFETVSRYGPVEVARDALSGKHGKWELLSGRFL